MRIGRYLDRQIAWTERELAMLGAVDERADLDALVAHQRTAANELHHLRREYAVLHREWVAASDVDEATRTAIQAQSRRSTDLLASLETRYAAAIETLNSARAEHRAMLSALNRGKALLTQYRPSDRGSASFLDREA